SKAHQETLRIGREAAKAREDRFMKEFVELEAKRALEDEQLARKYSVKEDLIERMKYGMHHKQTRAVSLKNAKLSDLAARVNAGRERHEKLNVVGLEKLMETETRYKNLTREEENILKSNLEKKRQNQMTGLCPTAVASSHDVSANIKSFHDKLMNLCERTQLAAICFFVRTDMSQTYAPRWIATPDAMPFSQDAWGQTMWDTTRTMEAWCITQKKKKSPVSFQALRTACADVVSGALASITGVEGVRMNYKNYEEQIVSKLGVKLVGWTYKQFVSPSEITGVDDLRTLHEALTTGACHWVRLSKAQLAAHAKDLAQRRAAGEKVGEKRKERIDKGVIKGPRGKGSSKKGGDEIQGRPDDSDEEGERVDNRKRRKTSSTTLKDAAQKQLPPQRPSSSEFVDSDGDLD
ncbi:hypothetical protein BJ165DRAFT_1313843, partial [Panaeolus papilionaceus]